MGGKGEDCRGRKEFLLEFLAETRIAGSSERRPFSDMVELETSHDGNRGSATEHHIYSTGGYRGRRRDAIEGEYQGALKVRLTAPPVDDRANDALRRLAGRAFERATIGC